MEYTLSEYLLALEDSNRELFDNSIDPCNDSKEYIIALLKYFSKLYNNVDLVLQLQLFKLNRDIQFKAC